MRLVCNMFLVGMFLLSHMSIGLCSRDEIVIENAEDLHDKLLGIFSTVEMLRNDISLMREDMKRIENRMNSCMMNNSMRNSDANSVGRLNVSHNRYNKTSNSFLLNSGFDVMECVRSFDGKRSEKFCDDYGLLFEAEREDLALRRLEQFVSQYAKKSFTRRGDDLGSENYYHQCVSHVHLMLGELYWKQGDAMYDARLGSSSDNNMVHDRDIMNVYNAAYAESALSGYQFYVKVDTPSRLFRWAIVLGRLGKADAMCDVLNTAYNYWTSVSYEDTEGLAIEKRESLLKEKRKIKKNIRENCSN